MFNFLKNSIKAKLIALMLFMAIVPLVISALIYLNIARKTIVGQNFSELTTSRMLRKEILLDNLDRNIKLIKVAAASQEAQSAYNQLKKFHGREFNFAEGNLDLNTDKYEKVVGNFDGFFKTFQDIWDFNNIYILGSDFGHVHYSTNRGADLGKNVNVGDYQGSALHRIWQQMKKTNRPVFLDYSLVGINKVPYAFMGTPIIQDDKTIGFLVIRLDSTRINKIFGEALVTENSSKEIFLIGEDSYMRSEAGALEGAILKKKIVSEVGDNAFGKGAGTAIIKGYNGKTVLSSYDLIDLRHQNLYYADFDWAIASQVDKDEAFKPIRDIQILVLILIFAFAVVSVVLAYFFAKGIANPLVKITGVSQRISDGDLTTNIENINRTDEIGTLYNSFKGMKENLRGQIMQITEAVNVLSSSVAEISTTISQLAASTTETVTSINQTTTTMQEVKQTAQVARERAAEVIDNSEHTIEVSEKGEMAVNANKHGMITIQKQMDQIAQSIVKLSEQSRTIGFIMDTINDLSEQSNLLAVNAAIEAAKAGDEGKGFGVVAGEIKNLANQSKKATAEVRDILSDIQKATSNAVLSTEEGSKAVDKGLTYSENAVESITVLADVLSRAVTAANQIGASSQQQFVGIDQVTVAMQSVNEASKQNLEGSKQLEIAADRLNELGKKLKGMVSSYKV